MNVKYLIALNAAGLVLYLIRLGLRSRIPSSRLLEKLLTAGSLLGGSLGVMLAMLLFDRKARKEDMLLRVSVTCIFIVQLLLLLMVRGEPGSGLSFRFREFFLRHGLFSLYLLSVNLITLMVFGADKLAAIRRRARIRITYLLGLAFLGGSVGALLGMHLFRHKTRQECFSIGIPMILAAQSVLLFYLMNR